MKKTYINPSMIVVRLAMHNVIAASPNAIPSAGVDTTSSEDPDGFETKSITDINIWDDEW